MHKGEQNNVIFRQKNTKLVSDRLFVIFYCHLNRFLFIRHNRIYMYYDIHVLEHSS